ncbi:MAG: hypothetical protein ACI814_000797 [Mariniblastus sp.]|jgi:hypothetical protein
MLVNHLSGLSVKVYAFGKAVFVSRGLAKLARPGGLVERLECGNLNCRKFFVFSYLG